MAKLYWRIKKNGKWTWKPVAPGRLHMDLVMQAMDQLNQEGTICDCGELRTEIAPAWCSNHEAHNL